MISDRSEHCVKCGCPTKVSLKTVEKSKFNTKINNMFIDLSSYEENTRENFVKYASKLRKQANISVSDATSIMRDIMNNSLKPEYTCEHDSYARVNPNQLRCPKCGSVSITTGQKGYSLLTGFLGSNKTVNRCGNCGYKWTPGR